MSGRGFAAQLAVEPGAGGVEPDDLDRLAPLLYLVPTASSAATEDASRAWAALRPMTTVSGSLEQSNRPTSSLEEAKSGHRPGSAEGEALMERLRADKQAAAEQVEELRVQLSRAEDFTATLRERLADADGA